MSEEEKGEKTEAVKNEAKEKAEVPSKFKKMVEDIEKMSVLELNELVKALESRFDVRAQAVAVGAPVAVTEDAEEQDSFTVELTDAGGQKIAMIKAVKELLGLGLKEAKDLVESAPTTLKEGVKKDEADEIKTKITEVGGSVELK
jgi:large subunit ribosomal protein L7/L12